MTLLRISLPGSVARSVVDHGVKIFVATGLAMLTLSMLLTSVPAYYGFGILLVTVIAWSGIYLAGLVLHGRLSLWRFGLFLVGLILLVLMGIGAHTIWTSAATWYAMDKIVGLPTAGS